MDSKKPQIQQANLDCTAAGCFFIDNQQSALFGYTPKLNMFSGIGGCIEEGETPQQCAFRETLEELYGIKSPSKDLIEDCITLFDSRPFIIRNAYGFYLLEGDDYAILASKVRTYYESVPYYERFPKNLFNLVIERTTNIPDMEITELIFMNPTYSRHYPIIDREFIADWVEARKYCVIEKYESDSSSE